MGEEIKISNGSTDSKMRDIIFFHYYSSPTLHADCFLGLSDDIAYRNMFLLRCGGKIHFEFPMFEDHSYSSICNLDGVKSLIRRSRDHEKYMIFRTRNKDTNKCIIVGYYRIGKVYYQETDMFNDNGFVWGVEASEEHLIRKDTIIYNKKIGRKYRTSWGKNKEFGKELNELLEKIKKEENISEMYKKETNRLVEIFKDKEKMDEWKENCRCCENKRKCTLQHRSVPYNNKNPDLDMFSVLHHIYTSNIYSRNVLSDLSKRIIFETEG